VTDRIRLDAFSQLAQGPTLSLTLAPGQSLAVVGPAQSGKTRFLRCLLGQERPGQGRAAIGGEVAVPSDAGLSRRATPQVLAKRNAPSGQAQSITDALSSTGLWDLRATSVAELSPTQLAACELIPIFASRPDVIVLDGHLERLDPWTRESVLEGLQRELQRGAAVVAATNDLNLLSEFDAVLIMVANRVAFAGTLDELLREADESEILVETTNQEGVRALVAPFEISIQSTPEGLLMRAQEGQAIAAKLLMEGYGDVRLVTLRPPTLSDAVRAIVHRTRVSLGVN
jgi:ABC-type multidrug transport system ATPase subunit